MKLQDIKRVGLLPTSEEIQATAERFADLLMTASNGAKATRLILWDDNATAFPNRRDLGGWCRDAIVRAFIAAMTR